MTSTGDSGDPAAGRGGVKGKTVLVTGGGTGIGAAVAERFIDEGAGALVMGRRPGPLEEVATRTGAVAVTGDCAEAADVRRAVARAEEAFGGLDVLVASAGGHGFASALDTDDAEWEASLRANLSTAFVAAREALPALMERGGSIVVIGSLASQFAGPDVAGYTASKHALIGLTRSLARDYGPHGVRVNVVCPGWVRTPMADEQMDELAEKDGITREEAYTLATSEVPLRRPAAPAEVAGICRFLASDDASVITGAVLMADGGASTVDLPTLAFAREPGSGSGQLRASRV